MIDAKTARRFWEKVDKRSGNECWPWLAARDEPGYGRLCYKGRMARAHRISYAIANTSALPEPDVYIRHKCDNPNCVNPFHLEIGTAYDNVQDTMQRRRHASFAQSHCKFGHELDGVKRNGSRFCKRCKRRHQRRHALRKKAEGAPADWQAIDSAPLRQTVLLYGDGSMMLGSWNGNGGWTDGDMRTHETHFTHWHTVPTPPMEEAK